MLKDLTREQQLERMRADFVANASHELRTPLASLLAFIETLQGPARSDAAARKKFLEMMRSQAGRMTRLIDDLLSLSRIELNAHRRPTGIVDLTSVVHQASELLAGMARQAGVAINLDVAPGLKVIGDGDELMQVMQNLMENAIKYAGSGKRIDIAAAPASQSEIEASVADYGPGIASEHHSAPHRTLLPGKRAGEPLARRHRAWPGDRQAHPQPSSWQALHLLGVGQGITVQLPAARSTCDDKR